MNYKVIIDFMPDDLWEKYAKEFADYNLYQTSAYQRVRARMSRQSVSRVIVTDEQGKPVTMCQVRIKNIRILRLKIGYVQWGPLLRRRDGINCPVEALQALRSAYIGSRVDVLRLVPNINEDEIGRLLCGTLAQSGFERVDSYKPYRTFLLKVDDSHEQIRSRLHKSFRRDLKKAEGAGLQIRQGYGDEYCRILRDLYVASIKRKGFKGLNPEEFIMTQELLSSSEKMSIFVVSQDEHPVAALLLSALGDMSLVLLAAADEKGLTYGASYLAWYQGAIAAHNAGMKIYDLGGIDPVKNPKVYQFKSRLGGVDVCNIGAFEAYASRFKLCLWRTCDRIYNLVK